MINNILQLSSQIKKHYNQKLKVHQLSYDESLLLMQVDKNPHIQQKQLAILMQKETPYITRLIDKGVEKGYLMRTPDPEDRRAFLITLNNDAYEILPVISAIEESVLEHFFSKLPSYEKEMLSVIISKLINTNNNS
jgi:DNA-binding MarR family transcriptional regulator